MSRKWVERAMLWLLSSVSLLLRWGYYHLVGGRRAQRQKSGKMTAYEWPTPVIQFSSLSWH